ASSSCVYNWNPTASCGSPWKGNTETGITLSGGGGSSFSGTITFHSCGHSITSSSIQDSGTGYTSAPTTAGGGSPNALTASWVFTTQVTSFTINNAGSGYTADPTVTIAPPGAGTQATATATIGRGTNYGKVWMLTALAHTKTGARAMAQLEVASPVIGYASDGGFGLLGPNPTIGQMPNSNNFTANGNDANSCGGTAQPPHPAITGYDDPNASPPTNSVQTITNSLPRPDHYIGAGGTPSVQN